MANHRYTSRLERLKQEATSTVSLLGDEFEDQLSLEELGFVEGAFSDTSSLENNSNTRHAATKSAVNTPEGSTSTKDGHEGLDGVRAESGVEGASTVGISANEQEGKGGETKSAEGRVGEEGLEDGVGDGEREGGEGGAPEPRAMDIEEPDWDALGDCIAMPAWKVRG